MAQPLANRVGTLIQHPQFIWWCGHCLVFTCFAIHLSYWITFRANEGASYYYTAYLGAMLSYGVVIYKSFGTPAPTWEYFQKINRDENVFYLVLACVWFMNAPVFATLLPYATFSLFHLITYIRQNIIPTCFPSTVPGPSSSHSSSASSYENYAVNASKFIQSWVHKNYDKAMRTVSFVEVVVITNVLIWNVLTFHLRFFTLFVYFIFLRMRYHMNSYTQQAFSDVARFLDGLLLPSANHSIHPYVTNLYRQAKSAVIWAGQFQPQSGRFNPQTSNPQSARFQSRAGNTQ
ncbi:endoplasmic reticulum protein [Gigaspora margarita]|uniref:Endoplasmic reticulum protein n=1 Tax=Gigaspora margarita TaxID=4874 RepID=A0A8H3XJA7_GIGMA|nr:endoplasmic reticulum protein [Gigaspora margarita]